MRKDDSSLRLNSDAHTDGRSPRSSSLTGRAVTCEKSGSRYTPVKHLLGLATFGIVLSAVTGGCYLSSRPVSSYARFQSQSIPKMVSQGTQPEIRVIRQENGVLELQLVEVDLCRSYRTGRVIRTERRRARKSETATTMAIVAGGLSVLAPLIILGVDDLSTEASWGVGLAGGAMATFALTQWLMPSSMMSSQTTTSSGLEWKGRAKACGKYRWSDGTLGLAVKGRGGSVSFRNLPRTKNGRVRLHPLVIQKLQAWATECDTSLRVTVFRRDDKNRKTRAKTEAKRLRRLRSSGRVHGRKEHGLRGAVDRDDVYASRNVTFTIKPSDDQVPLPARGVVREHIDRCRAVKRRVAKGRALALRKKTEKARREKQRKQQEFASKYPAAGDRGIYVWISLSKAGKTPTRYAPGSIYFLLKTKTGLLQRPSRA